MRPNTRKRTLSFLMHGCVLAVMTNGMATDVAPSKPNILFILADDLGYGDVQCLNPQRGKIRTPNLDRLAGQGMTFTDASENWYGVGRASGDGWCAHALSNSVTASAARIART